jgi:hypothetical protein
MQRIAEAEAIDYQVIYARIPVKGDDERGVGTGHDHARVQERGCLKAERVMHKCEFGTVISRQ